MVGFWVDGRPIYREIFTGSGTTTKSSLVTTVDLATNSNFSHFVDIKGGVEIIDEINNHHYYYGIDRSERIVKDNEVKISNYVYYSGVSNKINFVNKYPEACKFNYNIIIEYVEK